MFRKTAKHVARKVKRSILYGGYSKNVHRFLKETKVSRGPWTIPLKDRGDRNIYVNLSFDFELALNGYFWRSEFKEALVSADSALSNAYGVSSLLNDTNTQYNVQISTGLLDPAISEWPFLAPEQSRCIQSTQTAFSLNETILKELKRPNVELGVHSCSHRCFDNLSPKEIAWEVEKSVSTYKKQFGASPTFMAFPGNTVRCEDMLSKFSLCYRADNNQVPPSRKNIPIGLYWAPLSVSPQELKKVLVYLRDEGRPFFLHLWQHFRETNVNEICEYLDILHALSCRIVNVKTFLSLLQEYGG